MPLAVGERFRPAWDCDAVTVVEVAVHYAPLGRSLRDCAVLEVQPAAVAVPPEQQPLACRPPCNSKSPDYKFEPANG